MKKHFFIILALVVGIFFINSAYALEVVGPSPNVTVQLPGGPSYEMCCMPGGGMQLNYNQDQAKISISFSKASAGGRTAMPGPGQCSWFDRPISASEPSTMVMVVSTPQLKGFLMNSSDSSIANWYAEQPLMYFLSAFNSKKLFCVHCFNTGSVLQITKTGH